MIHFSMLHCKFPPRCYINIDIYSVQDLNYIYSSYASPNSSKLLAHLYPKMLLSKWQNKIFFTVRYGIVIQFYTVVIYILHPSLAHFLKNLWGNFMYNTWWSWHRFKEILGQEQAVTWQFREGYFNRCSREEWVWM